MEIIVQPVGGLNSLDVLAHELAAAHRAPARVAAAKAFADLSLDEAINIQGNVQSLLGETANASKVAIDARGRALAAPIYDRLVVQSGATVDLPSRGWLGIEVEIAVRLSQSITPELAALGVPAVSTAIESFHVGVELVGSRFDDRLEAGPHGQLADNMNTAGYVWSPAPWLGDVDVADIEIEVELDGRTHWHGAGKPPFGLLLDPLIAYGLQPLPFNALERGMLVTTGALCGLIEVGTPRRLLARIAGASPVEFGIRPSTEV